MPRPIQLGKINNINNINVIFNPYVDMCISNNAKKPNLVLFLYVSCFFTKHVHVYKGLYNNNVTKHICCTIVVGCL